MTASASRPPNFTFLSLPVRHSRASQLDKLTFPSRGRRDLPIQTVSFHLQSDAGESLPTTQLDLFRLYLFDTVSLDLLPDAGERILGQTNLPFQIPRWARLTRLTHEPRSSNGRRREHSRPDNLTFSSPTLGKAYPSNGVLISRRTSARASQPDNLTFSVRSRHNTKPPSNATYSVGQRRWPFKQLSTLTSWMSAKRPDQPLPFHLYLFDIVSLDLPSNAGERIPGQITLPFQVPRWRRLLVRHCGYCAPVGRRQKPPSQTTYRFILRSVRPIRLTQ
ncbi:hypothetical protein G5714_019977 [Onychostoma macrolepis]|uniref:Uncharacterized protein n=1 Tax=Onychostoma macrolepis TaxID=369639 RepID=A0A7J6BYI1_9TELE|nr:hypothetical protein G5714_019977 [Onychostoma macrolepis]